MSSIVDVVFRFSQEGAGSLRDTVGKALSGIDKGIAYTRGEIGGLGNSVAALARQFKILDKPLAISISSNQLKDALDKISGTKTTAKIEVPDAPVNSIADLTRRLDELKKTRDLSVDTNDLSKANNDIAETESKLKRMVLPDAPLKSISGLTRKLEDLKKTRDLSVNTSDIKAANHEIAEVEKRLGKLQQKGRVSIVRKFLFGKEGKANGEHGLLGLAAKAGTGVLGLAGKGLSKGLEFVKDKGGEALMSGLKKKYGKGEDDDKEGVAKKVDNSPVGKVMGKVSGMQESIGKAGEQFATALAPGALKLLDAFQPLINKLPAIVTTLTPYFEKLMKTVGELLPDIMGVGKTLMTALKPIMELATGGAMKGLLKSIVGFAGKIAKLLVPVFKILKPIMEVIIKVISKILDVVGWVIGNRTGVIEALVNWWDNLIGSKKKSMAPKDNALLSGAQFADSTKSVMDGFGDKADDKPEAKTKLDKSAHELGSSISGGGQRQIIMNLNAPLIKEQIFKVASMAEAVQVSLREQEELLVRMLTGAAAAVA